MVKKNHIVVRLWSFLNRWSYGRAKTVITIGDAIGEKVRAQMSREDRNKVCVIHNWADPSLEPAPKESNSFAREFEQVDKCTVLYAGNIGAGHGLDKLVDAAAHLEDDERVSFVIVGDGLGRPSVEARMRELKVENVILVERQPWERVSEVLATGDIAIVSQETGKELLSVPSKTYGALAAGSAIVALSTRESDLGALVTSHGVGKVCPGDGEEIATAIRGYLDDPDELTEARRRAREIATSVFSERAAFEAFRERLEPFIGR
jgi:glycosyltransferase involved in cell wall biosynthesis